MSEFQDGIGHADDLERLWTPYRMAYIRGENKPVDGSEGECPFCRIPGLDDEAGLVVRVPHPTDRRATVVELTVKGRGEVVDARCQALGKVTSLFEALSLEDQERFAGLVARLLPACRP